MRLMPLSKTPGLPTKTTAAMSDQAIEAIASALRTLEAEASGVTALATALQSDLGPAFVAAADLILKAKGRLIITGLGKSGHIGRKIAATFASTGTPAFFVHAAEASHGDLGMITPDDVIMALSWSGEQPEMKNLITYAKRFRIGVVAITSEATSTLAEAADVALTLPKAREACPHNLAPTTSSLMMLAMGDALAIALLEGRGFTSVDFSVLHPGGKLGAMLKYTRDLMHSGDAVPLKTLGTKMSDALVEMSSKGFGCVGITDGNGHVVGIVTDGDLRRHMRADLMTVSVDEVMTKNPKTISRDLLAGEALEILNSSKITALLVTDARKPVGIVHLHDLLRAGVA
jgi:arabinose-5-phosphate isomerase